jgi:hypothetical protein
MFTIITIYSIIDISKENCINLYIDLKNDNLNYLILIHRNCK